MSIAMSRQTLPSLRSERLPSLTALKDDHTNNRELPPLSELLQGSNNGKESSYTTLPATSRALSPSSLPTSPSNACFTDPLSHKLTEQNQQQQQQHEKPLNKTPIKLPSFDSLQFQTKKPELQKSYSTSATTTTSTGAPSMASLTTPAPAASLPTPISHTHQSKPLSSIKTEEHSPERPSSTISETQDSPLVEKRSFAFISHSPSTFPLQEPAIDNAQLARRKRRRTSPGELAILQAEFTIGSTPNRARREIIAKKVNMTEKAVQIWFQNRRQTLRRQSSTEKEVHHIEPVYSAPPPQAQAPVAVPMSVPQIMPYPQPIMFAAPFPQVLSHPIMSIPHSSSSPVRHHSSPSSAQEPSSSPNTSTISNILNNTPSRPPKGSTMTFRLTNKDESTPGKTMTPLTSSSRQRQKPTMKVNSQPTSSPIGKENVSPQSSPVKRQGSQTALHSPKRVPLRQLSFNAGQKPKDDAVTSLLNLRGPL